MLDKEVIPLRFDSGHHPHVHRSWPVSLVERTFKLASQPHQSHAHELVDKYVRCNASAQTVSFMRHAVASRSKNTLSVHTTRRHKTTEPRSLWLKLGYHPALPKVASLALKLKAPGNLKVRACWKNRLPSLMARIGGRNKPLIHSHGNGCLLWLAGGRCVSA